jgi:hypothetical protein
VKDVRELYPDEARREAERGSFYGPGDYEPLIESLGNVVLMKEDDDYQGDSHVLYKGHRGTWGYLNFGWGSCSGCDALQACMSMAEIEELRDSLLNNIRWGKADEIVAYLRDTETAGRYYSNSESFAAFREEAYTLLVPAFLKELK